jgi:hypothetical protein
MPRKAQIIGKTTDHTGQPWDVREQRPTPHSFLLALGWPEGEPRGRGGTGGPRIILTPELVAYLQTTRVRDVDLPVSGTAIKRLRRELGLHWRFENARWWVEHKGDLKKLTAREFAHKYSVGVSAAAVQRIKRVGARLHPAGWWREPEVTHDLLELPTREAAEKYGISESGVRGYRSLLKGGV